MTTQHPKGRATDALIHERRTGKRVRCTHENATRVDPRHSSLIRCPDCGEEFGDTTYAMAVSWWPSYTTRRDDNHELVEALLARPCRAGNLPFILARRGGPEACWFAAVDVDPATMLGAFEADADTDLLAIARLYLTVTASEAGQDANA